MFTLQKIKLMLQTALFILAILSINLLSVKAGKTVLKPSNPNALKTVDTICIGFIDGTQNNVIEFKELLKTQLPKQGFQVLQTGCDATLVGSIQAIHKYTILNTRYTFAYLDAQLLTPSHELIWTQHFESQLTSRYYWKNFKSNNGIVNRSVDVARALKDDKAKLLKQSP